MKLNLTIKICCILGLLFNLINYPAVFTSLREVQSLVEQLDEYPDPDQILQLIDWLDPSYRSYHTEKAPNFFERILISIGLKWPTWEAEGFKDLLNELVTLRESRGYKGRFVQKLRPKPGSQFILFGNIHGAFHSFVRSLHELKEQGIIDDSLKIIKDNCYLVFIGNVIDRSPFVLETLTLVMRLMFENPDKVFNIRGDHEDNKKWFNFALRDELELRIPNYANERDLLESMVDRLFTSLPLALYLVDEKSEKDVDVVRISSYGLDNAELQERKYYCFFSSKDLNETFDLTNGFSVQCRAKVNVRALIGTKRWSLATARGEYWGPEVYPSGGLQFIGKQNGIVQWAIMSSPTSTARRLFGFHFDSFVSLQTNQNVNNWKLSVFNRDLRKDDESFIEQTYFLIPKKEKPELEKIVPIKPVVEKEPLKIGSTLDLSKSGKDLGVSIQESLKMVINKINKQGGVKGRQIIIDIRDDEYTAQNARKNIEAFLNEKVDIILSQLGSSTLQSYLDLIKDKKVLVLFPIASATFPELEYIIRFRIAAVQEGYLLARYAHEIRNAKKIAIFYQDDPFGRAGLKGVTNYLRKKGISEYKAIGHPRNLTDFKNQVKEIKDYDPDSIIFYSITKPTEEFIRQMGMKFLSAKTLLGCDALASEGFRRFIKKNGLNLILGEVVPNPRTSQLEVVKEFRKDAQQYHVPIDSYSLETYIDAQLFIYLLNQIDGPITKEAILNAAKKIKDVNFKGLYLNYDPETRQLSNVNWLDTGKDEWEKIALEEEKIEVKKPEIIKEKPIEEKKTIEVGCTLDLSKSGKDISKPSQSGMEIIFKKVNEAGGIHGRKIEVLFRDDEYNPEKAQNNIKEFLDQGIDIILSPQGSPTLDGYLNFVKEKKVLVLFPMVSSPTFQKANLENLILFRPSAEEEGYAGTKYVLDTFEKKEFALFYQTDLGNILKGATRALKESGIKEWLDVPYFRNNVDFSKQVQKLEKGKPKVIGFFGTTTAGQGLIRQVGVEKLINTILYGNSDYSVGTFRNFIEKRGLTFISGNDVPDPKNSQIDIVKEFRTDAQKYKIPIETFALEGYINAAIFVYVLEQIKGPITKEAIIKVIEKIKDLNFKGLKLNFDPQTRRLSHTIWLDTGKDEWIAVSLTEEVEKLVSVKEEKPDEEIKAVKPAIVKQEKPLEEVKPAEKIKEEEELGERQSVLTVGTTLALTKYLRDLGKSLDDGLKLGINEINKAGGVKGTRIDLIRLDDYYEPSKARENVQRLLSEYGTNIIISPLGSPTLERYFDLVEQGKILVLFPSTGAPIFRKSDLKNIIHYRISFFNEAYELTKYFIKQLGLKKIAFFYQDDAYGRGPLEGARAALKDLGINDWIEIPYSRGQTNFEKEIKKIKEKDFEVLGLFSVAISSIEFIRQVGFSSFMGKQLFGISPIGERTFTTFLKRHNLKIVLAYPFPNPETSDLEIAKEFRTLAKQRGISLSTYSLEGYINASLLGYLLSKVKGFITNEKIISAAESIKNYNFKGLDLNFDPQKRQLSNTLWIDFGKKDWKKVTLGEEEK